MKTSKKAPMKQTQQRESGSVAEALKSRAGDTLAYRQVLDAVGRQVAFSEAFIVASVPRGGTQVVQPSRVPEVLVKSYDREFHQEDRATWLAMHKRKPLRGTDAFGKEYEQSRFLRDFMLYNCNFYHMVAAPLKAPVFPGYPGAVHLYRYREQGPFTDAEMSKLADACKLIDEAIDQLRQSRLRVMLISSIINSLSDRWN